MDTVDEVRISTVDTDSAPYSGATGGSKTIYTMGPAVQKAAQEARERVLKIAAAELEASVEDLELVAVGVGGDEGHVPPVGVPGGQPQGDLLPATADPEREPAKSAIERE